MVAPIVLHYSADILVSIFHLIVNGIHVKSKNVRIYEFHSYILTLLRILTFLNFTWSYFSSLLLFY